MDLCKFEASLLYRLYRTYRRDKAKQRGALSRNETVTKYFSVFLIEVFVECSFCYTVGYID